MLCLSNRGVSIAARVPLLFSRVTSSFVEVSTANKVSSLVSKLNIQRTSWKQSILVQEISPLARFYRSTIHHRKSKEKKATTNQKAPDLDDLLKDKTMGVYAKFKLLFQQYGVVLVVVHCITAVFWGGLFYFAVSRGFDIVPYLEKYKVFEFMGSIGLPVSDKLKSPGASNALAAYLLYEVKLRSLIMARSAKYFHLLQLAKPIRYPVTVVGTIYAVRILRRLGHLKPPPTTESVSKIVQAQSKMVQQRLRTTASHYRDRYRVSRTGSKHTKLSGHKNGRKKST